MIGKLLIPEKKNLFCPLLIEIINPMHELVILAGKIEMKTFEKEFGTLNSNTGKPGVSIRTMIGLLMLKRIYNPGDETVIEQWIQNPYNNTFVVNLNFNGDFPATPQIWFIFATESKRMERKRF